MTVSAEEVVVALDGVGLKYDTNTGPLWAIRDVWLNIQRSGFVAIVGPSGCGKSTLLKAISGLMSVAEGQLRWTGDGRNGEATVRSSLVFQSPRLLLWRTVLQNVTFGMEALGAPKQAAREKGLALLNRVGLSEFAGAYPRQLSGGMQQRVNLARAFGVDPEIILLDEPFASLDAQTREAMQANLNRIWYGEKTSAILVTHQVDEAIYLADRVVVLSARPARILIDVQVPFERPRELSIKRSAEFRQIEDEIWDSLESTIDASELN